MDITSAAVATTALDGAMAILGNTTGIAPDTGAIGIIMAPTRIRIRAVDISTDTIIVVGHIPPITDTEDHIIGVTTIDGKTTKLDG
ncbi:MAG: hypothetical protein ACYTA5_26255 [Planctomycetota bacterium]